MRIITVFVFLFYFIVGCSGKSGNTEAAPLTDAGSVMTLPDNNEAPSLHTVKVLEVIQVPGYTYLRVKEAEKEYWLAGPTVNTKAGDTLYFDSGMLMTNFESKELKKTFEKILFVDRISADRQSFSAKKDIVPVNHPPIKPAPQQNTPQTGGTKTSVKQNIKIEPAKNGIPIATLLKSPQSYEGKTVILRGKITKYTSGVMGKNWVHIQDGSEFNGKFEMVITTLSDLKDQDIATFEGKITLNKNLGFGYFFEVLMEDARVVR